MYIFKHRHRYVNAVFENFMNKQLYQSQQVTRLPVKLLVPTAVRHF